MLFKILKGNSSRISMDTTAFHEGYAYFTPDDGGFYIDAKVGDTNKRIRMNEKTVSVNATLTASGWANKQQTVTVSGLTATKDGVVNLAQSATDAQKNAALEASLTVQAQANNALTIAVKGTVPTVDIPITVIMLP